MVEINGVPFGAEKFGNGEAIYKDVKLHRENEISMKFTSNADITDLIMAVEYIRDETVNDKDTDKSKDSIIDLIMPYVPYSGMDRKINDQVFSLHIFANIINKLGFRKVKVLDPHSAETNKQIKNLEEMDLNYYVSQAIQDFHPDILYFPDKGAREKYPSKINTMGLPVIYGNKVRDLKDKGKIISYETITNGIGLEGKRVLIIDDICRLGGTFVWAAEELKKLNVKEIALYVSHCETGIFQGKLLNIESPVTKVYVNDSEPAFIELMDNPNNIDKAKKLIILR